MALSLSEDLTCLAWRASHGVPTSEGSPGCSLGAGTSGAGWAHAIAHKYTHIGAHTRSTDLYEQQLQKGWHPEALPTVPILQGARCMALKSLAVTRFQGGGQRAPGQMGQDPTAT